MVDKDGNVTVGAPIVEGAKVVCQVVSNLVKGDKVLVFHKKRRKGHRKLNGHRQQFTELTITELKSPGLEMVKPASITSTPKASSAFAT